MWQRPAHGALALTHSRATSVCLLGHTDLVMGPLQGQVFRVPSQACYVHCSLIAGLGGD